jgi:hypothetical protein
VNLVHEAMARESQPEEKKKKKMAKNNGRTRFIATLVTWVLLNLIWFQASHAIAVNEVNKHDRDDLNVNYVLSVPDMMSMGRETPVDLTCDFKPKNADSPIVWVQITHEIKGESEVLWEGNSTDECPNVSLSLEPGEHVFYTSVIHDDGTADIFPSNNLSADMELGMHLWEPFRIEGFVVANLLGLTLGLVDRAVRGILKKRRDALMNNLPLHKRRQKEEWEQINQDISGGDAVDVVDLIGLPGDQASESMEMQRQRVREKFAAQTSEGDGDTDEFVDQDGVEQDDELGPGTTEGLTGKVEQDQNIRTVGDLWRRLSGDDDDKKRKR